MSQRRLIRSRAPVTYTPESSGSVFDAKPKRTPEDKEYSTPKKAVSKRKADDEVLSTTTPTPKRRKRKPETLAVEALEKAEQAKLRAQKASFKSVWEEWQAEHDLNGDLLEHEPGREEGITQTDCQKEYGLKPAELSSLKHFKKPHPTYGNSTKLFHEEQVKTLACSKLGILGGANESDALKRGEELWKEESKNSPSSSTQ